MINVEIFNRETNTTENLELNKGSLSIGRLPKNDIYLDSSTVSRKHAELVLIDRKFCIVDLESGNGTFLNNEKVTPHHKNPISAEDVIRIEHFEIKVDYKLPEPTMDRSEDYTDHGVIEVKMLKKVLSALDEKDLPNFEITFPEDLNETVYFPEDLEEFYMGRDQECHLTANSSLVSRKHAVCKRKWGGITIKDLKSKNLTKVNGQIINEVALHDGDQIILGDIEIVFRNPKEINFEEISRDYEEVNSYNSIQPEHHETISDTDNEEDDEPAENEVSDQAKQSLGEESESPEEENQDHDDSPPETEEEKESEEKQPEVEDIPQPVKKKKKRRRLTCLEMLIMLGGLGVLGATSYLLYYLLK